MAPIRELYQAFSDCENESDLRDSLSSTLEGFGFSQFAYLGFNPPIAGSRVYAVSNYPEEWVGRYIAKNYVFSDPVLQNSRVSRLPFSWNTGDRVSGLTPKQVRILRECHDHGIHHGVAVPVYAPKGEFSVLTAIYDGPTNKMMDRLRRFHPHLYMTGVYFHTAIWDRHLPSEAVQSPTLTVRELDVLSWSARGKTNWEIAQILNLSENGVKFHLRNASKSLGAYSKLHAVTKAICLGLIRP